MPMLTPMEMWCPFNSNTVPMDSVMRFATTRMFCSEETPSSEAGQNESEFTGQRYRLGRAGP